MAAENLEVFLKKRPVGPFDPSSTFNTRTTTAPEATDLAPGQILIKTLALSLDPVMRRWIDGYQGISVLPGETMVGPSLNRVVASTVAGVKPGDLVTTIAKWSTYNVVKEGEFDKVSLPEGARTTDALGVLGFTGMTAYFGMWRLGEVKAGETVVVSAAAGATGSVACQLAKIKGARVVGIAGSQKKCDYLKSIGVDEVLNYKDDGFEAKYKEVVPEGIDLYYENVGGRMFELALSHMKEHGRIILCGDVSNYDTAGYHGIKSLLPIASKTITIRGLNIFHFLDEAETARQDLARWIQEGKLQGTETVTTGGLEVAPQALKRLLNGENIGKMIVQVEKAE